MRRLFKQAAVGSAGLTFAWGCVTNPATGQKELNMVPESQEISIGQQTAEATAQSVGLYPDSGLQAMVRRIGMPMALASERPGLPWSIALIDDPAVNAFAAPGGFVFVTRGLLTYLNSEAELATVLGHEIGHVTAMHSVQQMTKAQLGQLGLVAGMLFVPQFQQYGGLAQAGLQLLMLKYSRDDETQADDLGFKYALNHGWDSREMQKTFETFGRLGEGSTGRLPQWMSTHPLPENRVVKTEERVARNLGALQGTTVNRDAYLRQVDGMVFGENPREGYFEGTTFYHPDLKFKYQFPAGWKTVNEKAAVGAASPQGDAVTVVTLGGKETPSALLQKFLGQQGIQSRNVDNRSINGLPAASAEFQAQNQQQTIQGLVTYLAYGGNTYRLLSYTTKSLGTYLSVFQQTHGSFAPTSDPKVLNVQPARLQMVKLPKTMTFADYLRQYPSSIPDKQVAIINGLDGTETLKAGQLAKRVTGGLAKN